MSAAFAHASVDQFTFDRSTNVLSAEASTLGLRVRPQFLTVAGKTCTVNFEFSRDEFVGRGEDRELAAHVFKPLSPGYPTLKIWND